MLEGATVDITDTVSRFGLMPGGCWPETSTAAIAHPIISSNGKSITGVVILGLSPRRPHDNGYKSFTQLVARHLSAAITTARDSEEEKKRINAMAEVDRLKTAFFHNISHEFRYNYRVYGVFSNIYP